MSDDIKADSKVALVTGASRGIGNAIFKGLAQAGYVTVGTATTKEGADKLTKYLQDAGLKGAGYVLNVAQVDSVSALFDKLSSDNLMPNILVNNAGINRDQLFMRLTDEDWSDVILTNLTGVARVTKACMRSMVKARWGRIVTIGSVVGSAGNPGQTNYCAAKAGVIGFSKSLAREVASRSITVNVVAPGFMQSDMTNELNETQQANILAQIPMNKMGSPEDISQAVQFLVSEHAQYITGETLHVNGGMYMP
jgi:3-oxoacyl-[acyl-carrier protein] reductase